jgi:hypothetical protein
MASAISPVESLGSSDSFAGLRSRGSVIVITTGDYGEKHNASRSWAFGLGATLQKPAAFLQRCKGEAAGSFLDRASLRMPYPSRFSTGGNSCGGHTHERASMHTTGSTRLHSLPLLQCLVPLGFKNFWFHKNVAMVCCQGRDTRIREKALVLA